MNGAFTLSGNDTLDIVGTTDAAKLTSGVYEIVKTATPMNAAFKTVTYNGGALPMPLKVKTTDTSITLTVPPRGLAIIIR